MSTIETNAKPLLEPMIFGTSDSLALTPESQRFIATWAMKTMLMADFVSPTPIIPLAAYHTFFRDRLPPKNQAAIWTGAYGGPAPSLWSALAPVTISATHSFDESGVMVRKPSTHSGTVCTLRVWHAVFQVFLHQAYNMPAHPSALGEVIDRIWPERRDDLSWPPNGVSMDDAGVRLLAGRRGTVRYFTDSRP
jgi:hypothetical protein